MSEIERLKKQIESVSTPMTLLAIPENALLDGVVKLLKENTAFKDTDSELDEEIYHGDIFEQILSEKDLFVEKLEGYPQQKVLDQLEALAEFVSQDYVLITKV